MKKLLSALTVLTLVMGISATSIKAADIDQGSANQSGKTSVSTKVDPTYIVTIPEDCNIPQGTKNTPLYLVVTGNPQPDAVIKVDITKTDLTNKGNESYKIPYALTYKQMPFTGITYNESQIRTGTTTEFSVDINGDDWNKAFAGDYRATLNFVIQYQAVN